MVLEKTPEHPLVCKEIQPVHPKGDQSWVFIGGTDAEAETPILWPPDAKSWLIWKDPDAGKDWGKEEKGTMEDEVVGWHHQLNGCGFGWTLGVGDGQGGLVCCSSWGCKESDTTEQLNWTEHHSYQPISVKVVLLKTLSSPYLIFTVHAGLCHHHSPETIKTSYTSKPPLETPVLLLSIVPLTAFHTDDSSFL